VVIAAAAAAGVAIARLGATGGDALKLGGAAAIPLARLVETHETWLPDLMSGGAA